jgi:hypothetical protein
LKENRRRERRLVQVLERVEILAGCADRYIYVFSRDGDLLWKYRANDRIRALKVADVDNDGNLEIVVGSEDELEVLRVVNQQQVRELIDRCLSVWQEETSSETVDTQLLESSDPLLRAYAILRLTKLAHLSLDVFTILEQHARDGFVEVRKALLRATIKCYTLNPQRSSLSPI